MCAETMTPKWYPQRAEQVKLCGLEQTRRCTTRFPRRLLSEVMTNRPSWKKASQLLYFHLFASILVRKVQTHSHFPMTHLLNLSDCSSRCRFMEKLTHTTASTLLHLSFCPTTRRYIGLPSSLSPPSSHRGPCTFMIWSCWYDPISLPPTLYNIHLALQYDLAHSLVQYTSQSHSYDHL